jgi:hypothetical protein
MRLRTGASAACSVLLGASAVSAIELDLNSERGLSSVKDEVAKLYTDRRMQGVSKTLRG